MQEKYSPSLVKRLRERMGLTQEQFARAIGVTFSTVNQWENGRRRPQPFLLKRLFEMEASFQENPQSVRKVGGKHRHE
jgi:putative transcriptional regulator